MSSRIEINRLTYGFEIREMLKIHQSAIEFHSLASLM